MVGIPWLFEHVTKMKMSQWMLNVVEAINAHISCASIRV